ncbi:MAG: hypothetical protein OMM_04315 [Candidatus Magnetoglobus multicellularis str. Araruama]|uniref:NACHT domain-containing protein n=1 Tax=Candidatus Magnetoglobus multicellularis str. Araruama TaxID=890399 RepID=A0A1V1P1U3_9BACT|nr:MAG: hypothetical protein OMM_04315 [Candidatus Magnetoglobus multicellularis str. Araruama]
MAKIYISSTFKDLNAHREAVYKTLRQWGHDAIAMEDYVASDKRPLDKCLNDVASSDIYMGLFAWRYGYVPSDQDKSMAQSSLVSLSGIDPETAREKREELNLGSIYTALLTQSASDDARHHLKEKQSERLSALDMLNQHKHLVILGDPGSGKSTFVNFVAWCLAGESIQSPYANIERLTTPLPDDEGKDQEKRQSWDHGVLVPVRIILRDFVVCGLEKTGQKACADNLWQYIETMLKGAALGDYIPILKKELTTTGGLVMLDGLDEVPEANNRRVVMKEIIDDFKSAFHKCRILVTSRTYAYQKQDFRIKGLTETALSPFTSGQIRRFVDMWYAHIGELKRKSASDAQGRAESLKYAI